MRVQWMLILYLKVTRCWWEQQERRDRDRCECECWYCHSDDWLPTVSQQARRPRKAGTGQTLICPAATLYRPALATSLLAPPVGLSLSSPATLSHSISCLGLTNILILSSETKVHNIHIRLGLDTANWTSFISWSHTKPLNNDDHLFMFPSSWILCVPF